jgi:hypothetical protein
LFRLEDEGRFLIKFWLYYSGSWSDFEGVFFSTFAFLFFEGSFSLVCEQISLLILKVLSVHPIEFILEGVGCDSYHLLESTGLVLGVEVVSPQLKVLHFILFTKEKESVQSVCQGKPYSEFDGGLKFILRDQHSKFSLIL